ncbi:hypothetical protein, partial [Pseudomaricurvus hydrocarbonicus]
KGNRSNSKLNQGLKLKLAAGAALIATELGIGETSGLAARHVFFRGENKHNEHTEKTWTVSVLTAQVFFQCDR